MHSKSAASDFYIYDPVRVVLVGSDVSQHSAGGPHGPGSPAPGQHHIPAALPPVAVCSGNVWSCAESLGLPAQRLCQEEPLPLQVRLLPIYFLLVSLCH